MKLNIFQLELLPYNKEFEVPYKSIVFGNVIGKGAFGQVRIARAKKIVPWEDETIVAVKKLHNTLGGGTFMNLYLFLNFVILIKKIGT